MMFTSNCGLAFINLFYQSVHALRVKLFNISGSWGGGRGGGLRACIFGGGVGIFYGERLTNL